MKKSKGISRDIDLTENNIFGNGVSEILGESKYSPNTLPWNSNGQLKNNSNHDKEYIDDYTFTVTFNADGSITTFNDSWYSTKYINNNTYTNNNIIKYIQKEIHLPSDNIYKLYEYIDLYDVHIDLNKITIDIDYINDMITYKMSNDIEYTSSSYSSDTFSIRSTNMLYDITPEIFKSIKLTEDEMYDRCMITGYGMDLKLKHMKKEYFRKGLEYLKNKKRRKHNNYFICSNCNNRYHELFRRLHSSVCPECYAKLTQSTNHNKKLTKVPTCNDLHSNISRKRYRLDYHKRNILDDQQNIEFSDNTKSIDFFRQPIYSDRGVYFLRIPRRSHELQVDLKTNVISDDDSNEIRQSSFKPELRYNIKNDKYNYAKYHLMWQS